MKLFWTLVFDKFFDSEWKQDALFVNRDLHDDVVHRHCNPAEPCMELESYYAEKLKVKYYYIRLRYCQAQRLWMRSGNGYPGLFFKFCHKQQVWLQTVVSGELKEWDVN